MVSSQFIFMIFTLKSQNSVHPIISAKSAIQSNLVPTIFYAIFYYGSFNCTTFSESLQIYPVWLFFPLVFSVFRDAISSFKSDNSYKLFICSTANSTFTLISISVRVAEVPMND